MWMNRGRGKLSRIETKITHMYTDPERALLHCDQNLDGEMFVRGGNRT